MHTIAAGRLLCKWQMLGQKTPGYSAQRLNVSSRRTPRIGVRLDSVLRTNYAKMVRWGQDSSWAASLHLHFCGVDRCILWYHTNDSLQLSVPPVWLHEEAGSNWSGVISSWQWINRRSPSLVLRSRVGLTRSEYCASLAMVLWFEHLHFMRVVASVAQTTRISKEAAEGRYSRLSSTSRLTSRLLSNGRRQSLFSNDQHLND